MGIFRKLRRNKYICLLLLLIGCDRGTLDYNYIPEGFVTDIKLKFTPVKNQGRSELCWVYSMCGVLESEHMMKGDTLNLSTDYYGRMFLEEQLRNYYKAEGEYRFNLRGVGAMTLELISRYGALPEDAYQSAEPLEYNSLVAYMKDYADKTLESQCSEQEFMSKVISRLDSIFGAIPDSVEHKGKFYSPKEFGKYVLDGNSYVTLMSKRPSFFSKADKDGYYSYAQNPNLTDNIYDCLADNVSPDTLAAKVVRSLERGHAVMWEGGPNDNHAVAIVGLGHDKNGNRCFVAKNSWGTNNVTQGFFFIPEKYLKAHTALVVFSAQD